MRNIVFVIIFSLLVSFFLSYEYLPKAIVVWDEGTHMSHAYTMYTYLRDGDFGSYVRFAINQTGYPPLLPMVSSLLFLLTGFSFEMARRVNLIWFVLSSVLMYLLGRQLTRSTRGGLLSSFLFIFSPLLLLLHMLFMREGISITMTLLSILLYYQARDKRTVRSYVIVGLALFGVLIAKYNLGILVVAGFMLEALYSRLLKSHVLIFGVTGVMFALWMSYPAYKIPGFIRAVTDPVPYSIATVGQALTYYPMAILLTYSVSLIIGMVLLFSIVGSLLYFKDYKVRVVWFIFIGNIILATIHHNNLQERYIASTVPLLFLLTSKFLVSYKLKITWKRVLFGVLGIKIFIDLFNLPNFVYALGVHAFRTPLFNQRAYEETFYVYDVRRWQMPLALPNEEKPQDVADFIARSIDLGKPVWVDGYFNELSPGYLDMVLALEREKNTQLPSPYSSYTVTIEVLPQSRYYTADYIKHNTWQLSNIRYRSQDKTLMKITEKLFDELKIHVIIYGKI